MTETADNVGLRVGFTSEAFDRPSIAIVRTIASAKGISPFELEPLHGAIDLEAVDRLFDRTTADALTIEFVHEEHEVRISGEGYVDVRPLGDDAGPLGGDVRSLEADGDLPGLADDFEMDVR